MTEDPLPGLVLEGLWQISFRRKNQKDTKIDLELDLCIKASGDRIVAIKMLRRGRSVMSRILYFYATRADLLQLCSAIEAEQELTFTLAGELETPQAICYSSAIDIPRLGVARKGWILHESTYLALKRGAPIRVFTGTRSDGSKIYFVGQKKNLNSVEFRPAGVYKKNSIIQGMIGTISRSKGSVKLYHLFKKVLKKQFSLIQGTYVGAEALEFGKQGARLTQSIKQPTDIDLKIATGTRRRPKRGS